MKKIISVLLVVLMLSAVTTLTATATQIASFDVLAQGGEDRVTIAWDDVSDADTYSVYICCPELEYLINETVSETSYSFEPPYCNMNDSFAVSITAFDKNGSEIARSNDIIIGINMINFDYWSVYGDSDFDNQITVIDATNILKFNANEIEFDKAKMSVSDVDSDNKVTVFDATLIQRFCAGLETNCRVGMDFWYGGVAYEVIS